MTDMQFTINRASAGAVTLYFRDFSGTITWSGASAGTFTTAGNSQSLGTINAGVTNFTVSGSTTGYVGTGTGYGINSLTSITDWGTIWQPNSRISYLALTNYTVPNYFPANITDIQYMFAGSAFNQDIENWDMSNVTNMDRVFSGYSQFNKPLNKWNTSNVTSMSQMFSNSIFNHPIGSWNVKKVTSAGFGFMFYNATAFNQDLRTWNVSTISPEPSYFSNGATAWATDKKPLWGYSPLAEFIKPLVSNVPGQDFEIDMYFRGTAFSNLTVDTMSLVLKKDGVFITTIYQTGSGFGPGCGGASASEGETAIIYVSNYTYGLLPSTEYELFAYADDGEGDFVEYSYMFTTAADTTPPANPTVTIASPTNNQRPTWSWNTPTDTVEFRYKLNDSNLASGATLTTSTSYIPVSNLVAGTHTLYVQGRDAAGNWSGSGSAAVIINITAPQIAEQSPSPDASNVAKNTNISFTVTDDVEVNWNSLQVTIAGVSAIAGGVAQAGYSFTQVGGLVAINPEQDLTGGVNIAVSILVSDTSGNEQSSSFSFTTQSDTSIDVETEIDGTTSLGTPENPAVVNAPVTVASGGTFVLVGSSTNQITINAPVVIEAGGVLSLPGGFDTIAGAGEAITLEAGSSYIINGITKEVYEGTKLVLKRE